MESDMTCVGGFGESESGPAHTYPHHNATVQ